MRVKPIYIPLLLGVLLCLGLMAYQLALPAAAGPAAQATAPAPPPAAPTVGAAAPVTETVMLPPALVGTHAATISATQAISLPRPLADLAIPFLQDWMSSGHANGSDMPFRDWDQDTPPEVPTTCAKCHSTPGYIDYLGADGSAVNVTDKPAQTNTVVECAACHNPATIAIREVKMPSGVVLAGLGPESRCIQCHQGRASTVSVDASIKKAGVTDDDTPTKDLGFTNIHYFAAAATMYGTLAKGGYEYSGKAYDSKFDHVTGYDTCVGCHNVHTLQLKVDQCATCHTNVKTVEDLKSVRMQGSVVDYNGNGDVTEGIYHEIDGLRATLLKAIQAYASNVSKSAILYDAATYPYFLTDTNGNGQLDPDEAKRENAFAAWTARLAKAAYNYQVSLKDPGQFAHGGKYIIELLYDSIEDLNTHLGAAALDTSKMRRIDSGHFASSEEAWRHWDEDGAVPATCSKCHSAGGLPLFIKDGGATISQPPANGMMCSTCHDSLTQFTRYELKQVKFPSGAVLDMGDPNSNLCAACHQGRESTVGVNTATQGIDDDTVSEKLTFRNPHYFAAASTVFGTDAKGAYEYTGKTYLGRSTHPAPFNTCVGCHDVHGLTVKVQACAGCHPGAATVEDLSKIKMAKVDYNGNGNADEGMGAEIAPLHEALYAAIQEYAKTVIGKPIVYTGTTNPYFFNDTNGNGQADPDEMKSDNRYNSWTPRLLRGAFNYQWVQKDPGTFAHNGKYIVQILLDSLENLGQKVKVNVNMANRPQ